MPGSSKEGKMEIKNWILDIPNITKVLDLGIGSGTYYNFFCEKHDILTNAEWTGVEIWKPYIVKYELEEKYKVINEDVRFLNYNTIGKFDITFAGDILEHVTKDEALVIVDKVLKITNYLFISIPIIHYPQGAFEGNPYEVHVKDDWSHTEMIETFPQIKKAHAGKKIGVYMLQDS